MSKNSIRQDKTCLNCFYVVDQRFCPNCGQENIETRKTFLHLFVHFFEDLTHYENAFWKTIGNLILRPASLTKEYLSGKRMSYLAPVRLYIFISFVTFLFVAMLPRGENDIIKVDTSEKHVAEKYQNKKSLDSIKKASEKFAIMGLTTVAQLDSVQKIKDDKLPKPIYWTLRKMLVVSEKHTTDEIVDKFKESFMHNLPKVLFIYLPFFALLLWLFQNKKKYYYFDHGIFTLHYFSFLLLGYMVASIIRCIFSIGDIDLLKTIGSVIRFICIIYMLYYFFPAHHRFYRQSRIVTILKGSVMFVINVFFIFLILVLFAIYTFINIH